MKLVHLVFQDANEKIWKEVSIDLDKVKTIEIDFDRRIIFFDEREVISLGRNSFYKKVHLSYGTGQRVIAYESAADIYEELMHIWLNAN